MYAHPVVSNSATLWTVANQAPLSMEFPKQEYCDELPFLSPGDLLTQGSISHLYVSCTEASSLEAEPSEKRILYISSVQSVCVWLLETPLTAACQASLSITNSQSLFKLSSIESVMPSNHLIFCHPLLLLPFIFLSTRVFSNESVLPVRWPKYWSFSFNISPSNEHPGLISFRMDWLSLLAGQGTLKNLLQHCSSKASILWCSAFFMVQLSHPYTATGKTTALAI